MIQGSQISVADLQGLKNTRQKLPSSEIFRRRLCFAEEVTILKSQDYMSRLLEVLKGETSELAIHDSNEGREPKDIMEEGGTVHFSNKRTRRQDSGQERKGTRPEKERTSDVTR